jgi:tripartite-type tricarboxylate transporter receptor subunit TctC
MSFKPNVQIEGQLSETISRRKILSALGAAAGAVMLPGCGRQQNASSGAPCRQLAGKRMRWIVPNAVGGGFDAESRLIKPFLEAKTGAQIAIENMPGAGGLVGAKTIMTAPPDGLTLGMVSAPGLLASAFSGEADVPMPATDFTVLGRVARSWQIWATGARLPFKTIEEVMQASETRPLVFAINEVGSANFVAITVSSFLLGARAEMVAGYSGNRAASLAAVRGEVDLVCFNFDTILDMIVGGDLRPLLQLSAERISAHACLDGVPLLCGEKGLAARRAARLGRDIQEAVADARGLTDLIGAGRLVVAPPRLEDQAFRCLAKDLREMLTDPAFQAAAARMNRSLDPASADVARNEILTAAEKVKKFIPLIRKSMQQVRG